MSDIQLSPLDAWHRLQQARMVSFAGMSLPIQYPNGIKTEHLAARETCALFDVSHMVQIHLTAQSDVDDVLRAIEPIFPIDLARFKAGQTRYSFLLNTHGGILDDVMISHGSDRVIIVANGARRDHDPAYLRELLPANIQLSVLEAQAFLAFQGPVAAEIMAQQIPDAIELSFMQMQASHWHGEEVHIFRQGYSGEDGFEVSLPAHIATNFAETLCADPRVIPAGLGARDSLRLEAGLPLWGQDIDENTSPLEANLGFAIAKARRLSADFIGAKRLVPECATPPELSLVGLKFHGKQPARAGVHIHQNDSTNSPVIGTITSGGVSPSLSIPIALAKLSRQNAAPNTTVYAEVRGKMLPATITPLPFVAHRYFRKT